MPPLLQSAQLKPDVTITSADSDNELEESDDEWSTPPLPPPSRFCCQIPINVS